MGKTKVTFNVERLQYSVDVLYALAHPLRLRILEYIDKHGEINVNRIYRALGLEQSITSQHLKVLRLAGIVHAHRDGKFILYTVDYPTLQRTESAINNFMAIEKQRVAV
jgi:ArsR family transcriptional regulator